MHSNDGVTQLLVDWDKGDQAALDKLMPLVYNELRRLASNYLRRERPGHTLQPTALGNEAYLKLIDQRNAKWQNRAQFFGISAQLMRRILVDHARQHQAAKRGGSNQKRLSITSATNLPKWIRNRVASSNSNSSAACPLKRLRKCWPSHTPRSSAIGKWRAPGYAANSSRMELA